ncbi:MAG: (2Fe-2S) ferredoxin domain-containing protein [Deltaproteobacteria bacterium]|nr:(2Fe-2S) ferredoxin domain-containing protein [Deltaproteobacteria bacterium]
MPGSGTVMKIETIQDLEAIRRKEQETLYHPPSIKVNVGMASCGIAAGAKATLERALKEFPTENDLWITQTGCLGFCEEEPLVEMFGNGRPRVVCRHLTEDKVVDAIRGYQDQTLNPKWILGQVRDPGPYWKRTWRIPWAISPHSRRRRFSRRFPFTPNKRRLPCGIVGTSTPMP